MEDFMSQRKVIHVVKLPLSLTIILGVLAFGLIANVFGPVFNINEASASVPGLTKNDIKEVLENCSGLINNTFMYINWN